MELSEAAIQARAEYQRKWRAKNRDKLREYNIMYWERKADEQMSSLDRAIKQIEQPEFDLNSEIIRLHGEGLSLRAIGDKLGISHMKAKRLLQDL